VVLYKEYSIYLRGFFEVINPAEEDKMADKDDVKKEYEKKDDPGKHHPPVPPGPPPGRPKDDRDDKKPHPDRHHA